MKFKFTIFFIIILFAKGFAQETGTIPSTSFPRLETKIPEKEEVKPQYSINKPFEIVKFKKPEKVFEVPKLEKNKSLNQPKSDLDVGKLYAEKLNKKPTNTEGDKSVDYKIFRRDMFFGELRTKFPTLTLKYRDYSLVDGDIIKISLNGSIILEYSSLESFYKEFKVNLVEGINFLEIEALNEGYSSPNTGDFEILEANGKVLTVKMWEVAKGFKAKFVILKE